MLLTVTWPAKRPSTSTTNGIPRPSRACRLQPGAPASRNVAGALAAAGRDGGVPRLEPGRVATAHGAPGPRVAVAQRPERDLAVLQGQASRPALEASAQWSLPTICSTACTSRGSRTARPSFTPPREPGQVDHEAVAHDAGQAPRQGGGRHPLRDAVGPDRLGDARHLPVEQGPGDLGGEVGRGEPGAAGGEHDAGTARRPRRRWPSPTGAPSGTTTGWPQAKPRARRSSTSSGPVASSYTPAAARLEATTTAPLMQAIVGAMSAGPVAGLAAGLGSAPGRR